MPKLNLTQCRSLVYRYFLNEGWLPRGTTRKDWDQVTIGDLDLDEPPVPSDPHQQKKRVALDLQNLSFILGSGLPSPLEQLKKPSLTLGEFAGWCCENQT